MKTVQEVGVFRRQARKLVGELSFSSKSTLQLSVSSYSVSFVTQKDAKIARVTPTNLIFFCYWFLRYLYQLQRLVSMFVMST